jgi:hypothetical protein
MEIVCIYRQHDYYDEPPRWEMHEDWPVFLNPEALAIDDATLTALREMKQGTEREFRLLLQVLPDGNDG